jgi:hypothetical protein
MGASAGTSVPTQLQPGEKLWRLIEYSWYQPNSTGSPAVIDLAFIGNLSLVRGDYLSEATVDAYVDQNGLFKFAKAGIAVLSVDEILKETGAQLNVTADSYGWPADTHVELRRSTGGKELRITHPEVVKLTNIANANSLVRLPKP